MRAAIFSGFALLAYAHDPLVVAAHVLAISIIFGVFYLLDGVDMIVSMIRTR